MKSLFIYYVLLIAIISQSCNTGTQGKTIKKEATLIALPFVSPPLRNVNVPFETYTFLAEKGDTIFSSGGSILIFPPHSLVDVNGHVLTGNVSISYREFRDPIDFYLSGIPMSYDSAGIKYTFESAGMCEVNAMVGDDKAYVNPASKPEINLLSKDNRSNYNLYFLDTVQKKWITKGKDIITDLGRSKARVGKTATKMQAPQYTEAMPLKPAEAVKDLPVVSIQIAPGSIPELSAYDNLKFQVDKSDRSFSGAHANEEWSDIRLDKTSTTGLYKLNFMNAAKKVAYLVRPVFEGEDYHKAMKVFEEKNKEYQQLLARRQQDEKKQRVQFKAAREQQQLQNERTAKENERIALENDRIMKLNMLIEARNKEIATYNEKVQEAKEKQRQLQLKYDRDNKIFRTFTMEGFGIWNCDHPTMPAQEIPITASFKDEKGTAVALTSPVVVYKNFNGITAYGNSQIRVIPGADNMIWGTEDSNFVYLSYEAFKKCSIDRQTTSYSFTVKIHPATVTSYDDIKKIAGDIK